jgi:hypothetical protein
LVNNNLIEHGDNGTKLIIEPVQKIVKYAARFFNRMDNHILEGTFPNSVPKFTPRDANPRYQIANVIVTMEGIATVSSSGDKKSKSDASPPGTPAQERNNKKQKLKPAAGGSRDFTKAGLFHCAEGTATTDLFSSGLSKPLCVFFCFHNKKRSKPNQACKFNHIGKWDKIPANNQAKILNHCHASKEKKVWLNAKTFTKHKTTVPDKFAYLLGDAKGAKST